MTVREFPNDDIAALVVPHCPVCGKVLQREGLVVAGEYNTIAAGDVGTFTPDLIATTMTWKCTHSKRFSNYTPTRWIVGNDDLGTLAKYRKVAFIDERGNTV